MPQQEPRIFPNKIKKDLYGEMVEVINASEYVRKEMNRFYRAVDSEPLILDTVGLEMESVGLTEGTVKTILGNLPRPINGLFKYHNDASTQMKVLQVSINGGKKIYRDNYLNAHNDTARRLFVKGNGIISGYELVSTPMSIQVAEVALNTLLPKLTEKGDFLSERCATHVHIGMAKNLSFLKNLLSLGLWADELFYSISGMEGNRPFRGYSNNAIYARPLISGPYVKSLGGYFQILNWETALNADSLADFFSAYGYDYSGEAGKYNAARYFALNLYSVILHKTLEFRHANQSLNPRLVTAFTKLCQMFAEIGVKANKDTLKSLEPGDVFVKQSPSYYETKLEKIIRLGRDTNCDYSLRRIDVIELCRVIQDYKGIGIQNKCVLSHVKDASIDPDIVKAAKLKPANSRPIPAGHIDIHNIGDISIINERR